MVLLGVNTALKTISITYNNRSTNNNRVAYHYSITYHNRIVVDWFPQFETKYLNQIYVKLNIRNIRIIMDKFCSCSSGPVRSAMARAIMVFSLSTTTHPNFAYNSCFSDPCGRVRACEDTLWYLIVIFLRNTNLRHTWISRGNAHYDTFRQYSLSLSYCGQI